jgi:hypothetical protein
MAAAATRGGPADTLLPGALPRPDNLLPRPVRSAATTARPAPDDLGPRRAPDDFGPRRAPVSPTRKRTAGRASLAAFARVHWRRIIVVVVVAIALTVSLTAVWPVVFRKDVNSTPFPAASAAREQVATDLLRTVVGGGRTMYAPGHTYPVVTPEALSSFSYNVPIVGPRSTAAPRHVSMRLNSAQVLTLATPADAERCVFARDEPAKGRTRFVTVRTTDCRAIAAPAKGWHTR